MNLDEFKTLEELAVAIKSLDIVTAIPWTDYSATSTITGWSSYTYKLIYYKKITDLIFVQFYIRGTSDSTSTNFSLPFAQNNDLIVNVWARIKDNGGAWSTGFAEVSPAGSTCYVYPTAAGGSWTASGEKGVLGQFWYETS
jgi:hypothetical protein